MATVVIVACDGMPTSDGPGIGSPSPGPSAADLIPLRVDAPPQAAAGALVTLHVGVRNAGGVPVGPGWAIRVYLSADAVVDTTDVLIDQFVTSGDLRSGGTDSYLRNKKLSGSLVAGVYFIGSMVDVGNVVPESAESNNTLASPSSIEVTAPSGG